MFGTEALRLTPAAGLTRYRVGSGTRLVIVENFAMRVASGFIVAGLLSVQGILIVSKKS